jgi:hypothetical protein
MNSTVIAKNVDKKLRVIYIWQVNSKGGSYGRIE